MFGLTIRWSLTDAPPDTLDILSTYVEDVSFTRFAGLEGLRHKTWRARPGEWFEGTYVFIDDATRAAFQADVEAHVDETAGTRIIGSRPVLIEPCHIVASVRGRAGFRSAAAFET